MAVNTLLKDSSDDDPAICGLALRSLCSLRAPNMIEYVEPAVRRGLTSRSGYVRRTATIGVLKLWHLNPALVDGRNIDMTCEDGINKALVTQPNIETDSLVEILFAMMNDIDPQVDISFVLDAFCYNANDDSFAMSTISQSFSGRC